MWSRIAKYIVSIMIAVFIMAGLLVLVARIPREAIRDKALESAEYLFEGELFGNVLDGVDSSRIDRYADAILLNIAWNYNKDEPLKSVMLSSFYSTLEHEENENFLISVRDDTEANTQYLRYWHGSIAIVRPLLLVFSVKQIYILNAILLCVLYLLFIMKAVRSKETLLAVGMTIALAAVAVWFVPMSLEYTWIFIVMLVTSIILLYMMERKDRSGSAALGILFLLTGMVTNYIDFLTAETVTLLVPLLLLLWLLKGGGETQKGLIRTGAEVSVLWLMGYGGMMIVKWTLASIVLGESAIPYVMGHIEERIGGDLGLGLWQYLTGAVLNNVGCLFPLGYGGPGLMAGIALLIYAAYRGYVYRVKDFDRGFILLVTIVGLVPYLRYLVLHNHSYIHFFFTFRAQAATVLAVVMIVGELTGKNGAGGYGTCCSDDRRGAYRKKR